jgi:lysophospholipase L1-like esterase
LGGKRELGAGVESVGKIQGGTGAMSPLTSPRTEAARPQGAAVSKPPSFIAEGALRRFENRRSLFWTILVAICLGVGGDWFSASTQRLYVDEDSAAARQEGTVWQHFGVRGNEVVPEIISRDRARFVFPVSLGAPHSLLFSAYPEGAAEYTITLRSDGTSRQIAARKITSAVSENISIPAGKSELEFAVEGKIAWFDLRLTRKMFLWPAYLGAFLAVAFTMRSRPVSPASRRRIGNWLALGLSTFLSLAVIEAVLRLVSLKLPPAILNARHDLGLFAPDPRWIESPRYKQRLRPNLDTYCEWKFGDIVRMGFIPPELFGAQEHRYPFRTDAEGFRNPAVRDQIDVAALGDSFTDAMASPTEEAWPVRLEKITGRKVQNYGTSAFGPQQELYVLQDYAIHHRPGHVVLAFFAGNDLFDAERFDRWEREGDKPGEETTGWRLVKKFRRYQTLYLSTLARVAMLQDSVAAVSDRRANGDLPRFDRGIFEIPTAERGYLRFAFMPPYLQKLATSRDAFERSRGWELTRATLLRMKETSDRAGSRLSIMFVPSKAEVYWPLVEHSLGPEELQQAIDFCCLYNHMKIRPAEIRANRLAQNDLLRDFCARENIPFVDLTPALEKSAGTGHAVYYVDDDHLNAAGHEIAAQELARFLAREP